MSDAYRDFIEYVERYAAKHNLTIEEAKETAMCKAFKLFIADERKRDSDGVAVDYGNFMNC